MEEEIKQVETISVPETPVQLPKKSNLSKIVPLFILGLIILAGAVYAGITIGRKLSPPEIIPQAVEASPTPSETADWETYTNMKHNYSFSYPKNYFLTAERFDGYDDMVVLYKLTEGTLEAYGKNLNRLTLLSEEGLIWNLVLTKPIVADLSLTIPKTCIKKNNSGGYLYYSCPDVLPPEPEIGKGNNAGAEFYVIGEQEVSGQNKMIFPMYLTRMNPPRQGGKFSNEEIKEIESIIDTFKFFPDVDETANWKTYKNEKYYFSVDYPQNLIYETNDQNNFTQITFKSGQTIFFQVEIMKNFPTGQEKYFLDTESNGEKKINGVVWKTYSLPKGYCDMGGCTSPIYALQTKITSTLYSISFYGQSSPNEFSDQILSTFKFLD